MSDSQLFGSSGIRGDAASFFTNQLCFDLGRSFALFLKKHNLHGAVAVGMDPRESSPRIKSAFIQGVLAEKFSVLDEGIIPIPAVNWVLRADKDIVGSIMVTGSHIKAHLNGLKFFAFDDEILKEHEREIQTIYNQQKNLFSYKEAPSNKANLIAAGNHSKDYISYILAKAEPTNRQLKIVVDAGNGAQSIIAPEILRKLGHNVITMYTNTNDTLLSRDTEVSGDFIELQKRVKAEKADLGIGFDSDGDRIIFIDENAEFIPGDYSGALIAKHYDTDSIVTPINTSQVVDHLGKPVYRTKVGSPYVVGKMKEVKARFGFEANGGGIFSDMYSRDGGRSMIEFLDLLQLKNKTASELMHELPRFYIERDKIDYDPEKKAEIIKKAKEQFSGSKFEELDGLKIWVNSTTWILFRSSANAPEFRIFTESDKEDVAKELLKRGMELITKYKIAETV